MCINLLFR